MGKPTQYEYQDVFCLIYKQFHGLVVSIVDCCVARVRGPVLNLNSKILAIQILCTQLFFLEYKFSQDFSEGCSGSRSRYHISLEPRKALYWPSIPTLSFFFFLYMINIAYCNLKDFDYATDLLSDLSLGIETSVVDRLICYFILQACR